MKFDDVDDQTCMHGLAVEVADELREPLRELFVGQYGRAEQLEARLPNAVLAGLTLLWLESIHAVFGTADYESAVQIVAGIKPNDKRVCREMSQAARDFLRRAEWLKLPRRKK